MRTKRIDKLILPVVVFSCLLIAGFVRSVPKRGLPRSYGPLVLGMSVNEFKAATGTVPLSCVECPEGELLARLFSNEKEAERYGGTYFIGGGTRLDYLPQSIIPPIIDCYFYDGKLYIMEMYLVRADSQDVINRYQKALGLPCKREEASGGQQSLYWESFDTRLRLTCSKIPGKNPFVQIDYYDMNILKKVPKYAGVANSAKPAKPE